MVRIVYVPTKELTSAQNLRIMELQRECFSHVSRMEIEECFIAESFGRILASRDTSIIGQTGLFKREVLFESRRIFLGGIGGVCVTASERHQGVGRGMVKRGLAILKRRGCHIACLSANLKEYPDGGLYHRLGFRLMGRRISFEDVHERQRYDSDEMFIPVCSKEICDLVMSSGKTFHMGRGYWLGTPSHLHSS